MFLDVIERCSIDGFTKYTHLHIFLEVYLSLKYHTNKYESINWGIFLRGEGGGGNDG